MTSRYFKNENAASVRSPSASVLGSGNWRCRFEEASEMFACNRGVRIYGVVCVSKLGWSESESRRVVVGVSQLSCSSVSSTPMRIINHLVVQFHQLR
jgi:hypothetical protein